MAFSGRAKAVFSSQQGAIALRLDGTLKPETAFRHLARRPGCVFLDSALPHPELGRFSYLAADPLQLVAFDDAEAGDCWRALAEMASPQLQPGRWDEAPPFQGGVVFLLCYELNRTLEPSVPAAQWDEFALPRAVLALYDTVLAWDHRSGTCWLFSQGWPESDPGPRHRLACRRAEELLVYVERPSRSAPLPPTDPVAPERLAPQFATPVDPRLSSDFAPEAYRRAVQRVREYIAAGDAFQVNLSQRLLFPQVDAVELALHMRRQNAAPFAAYWNPGSWQLVSASPERFLHLHRGQVEARPIKGTRPRSQPVESDSFAAGELLASGKDQAENVMIVDLWRNDLSRVCLPESVRVDRLCALESYAFVHHLVSVVRGQLAPGQGAVDLLQATFPSGSVTGAPKVRAMQIIAELEPTVRGPYCGTLGYLTPDGTMDCSVLIRTVTASRGWCQLPAGGGITTLSDPQAEWEETWHKARGLLRALRACRLGSSTG